MLRRMLCVGMAVASMLIACSSEDHNEGGSCSTNDDCGGNLACQPIQGRQGAFCCPTPPDSSSQGNCHAQ